MACILSVLFFLYMFISGYCLWWTRVHCLMRMRYPNMHLRLAPFFVQRPRPDTFVDQSSLASDPLPASLADRVSNSESLPVNLRPVMVPSESIPPILL